MRLIFVATIDYENILTTKFSRFTALCLTLLLFLSFVNQTARESVKIAPSPVFPNASMQSAFILYKIDGTHLKENAEFQKRPKIFFNFPGMGGSATKDPGRVA